MYDVISFPRNFKTLFTVDIKTLHCFSISQACTLRSSGRWEYKFRTSKRSEELTLEDDHLLLIFRRR